MANDNLTVKQEKFAQGLFAGMSQRDAYKQAYNCTKMADKTIDENACRLANDSKFVARINELTDKLTNRNMVTVEKVLAELTKIGFADIKDFLEFRTEKTLIEYDDQKNPIYGYKNIVVAKPSDQVDGTMINEVSIGKDGTFKFKLHNKDAALEKIGKYFKMFTDKVEHTGADGGPIQIQPTHDLSKLTDDELAQFERLSKKTQG